MSWDLFDDLMMSPEMLNGDDPQCDIQSDVVTHAWLLRDGSDSLGGLVGDHIGSDLFKLDFHGTYLDCDGTINNILDTGADAARLGISGSSPRTLYVEYYHPDSPDAGRAVCGCGIDSTRQDFTILRDGYTDAKINLWGDDHVHAVSGGFSDYIVRLVVTYDGGTLLSVTSRGYNINTGSWESDFRHSSRTLGGVLNTSLATNMWIGDSMSSGFWDYQNAPVYRVMVIPSAIDQRERELLIDDPNYYFAPLESFLSPYSVLTPVGASPLHLFIQQG